MEKTNLLHKAKFDRFLIQSDLMSKEETPRYRPLPGGVSSDIWLVELPKRQLCIKQALAKLKVKEDWYAPISRNATEVDWLITANSIVPKSTPKVFAHDPHNGMFAMQFIPPNDGRPWKAILQTGSADPTFASTVGSTLATIHSASANIPDLSQRFSTDDIFRAIRLVPYFETTANRHPDVKSELLELTEITASSKLALVHGDISPKNILVCGDTPVFIDAECAWWGDPAFDIAFCLNHLLLKCIWVPEAAVKFLLCFDAMTNAYRSATPDHYLDEVENRAARLLPALLLSRIDGKSPVEYITCKFEKDRVRNAARNMLKNPVTNLENVANQWAEEIGVMI
ncbi:MAG: aminoglycoside phosphotransferase [Magnetovibrio sp.]|nr:aminoglycoside phosphotransferase [Magnetovibrio sp.]